MTAFEVSFVVGGLVTAYVLGWGMGMIFLTFKSISERMT